MGTVLKVAAGVVLGGAVLAGLAAGVLALVGGDRETPDRPASFEERLDAAQEETEGEGPSESYDAGSAEEALVEEEDPGTEWCDSEKGDRVAQLDGTYNSIKSSPARVKRLQDSVLAASDDAPPGAYCVESAVDTLIFFWNNSTGEPKARRFNPREQVRRLRDFMREGRFAEGF